MRLKNKRFIAFFIALILLLSNFLDCMPVFADEINETPEEPIELNEINLLGDDEQYTYTIYFYFDGTKDESKTEVHSADASSYPLTINLSDITDYSSSAYSLDSSVNDSFTLTDNNQYINIMYNTTATTVDITLNYINLDGGAILGNEVLTLPIGTDITELNIDDLNPPIGYKVGYLRDGTTVCDFTDDLYDNPFIVSEGGPTSVNISVVPDTKLVQVYYDTQYELDTYSGDLGGYGNTADSGWISLPKGTVISEIPFYPGNSEAGSISNIGDRLTMQTNGYRTDWVNMGYEVNYFSDGTTDYYYKPGDNKTINNITVNEDMTLNVHYDLPTSYTIHYMLNDGTDNYIEDDSLKEIVPDWCLSHNTSIHSEYYKDIDNYEINSELTDESCLQGGALARNGANDCYLYYDKAQTTQNNLVYIIDNYYDRDEVHTYLIPEDRPTMTIQDILDSSINDLQSDCRVFTSSIYDPTTYDHSNDGRFYYYSYNTETGYEFWGGGMCLDASLTDTFDFNMSPYPCIVIVHPYQDNTPSTDSEVTYTVHYFFQGKDFLGWNPNGSPNFYKEETSLKREGTSCVGEFLDTLSSLLLTEEDYPRLSSYNLSGDSDMITFFDEAKHYDINIYYDMIIADYNIYYYYDGVLDDSKTETTWDMINIEINTYTDKVIDGYVLDKVVTEDIYGNYGSLPLVLVDKTNLDIDKDAAIHVYYKTKTTETANYEIHYFFDNIEDTYKKEIGTAEVGTIVNARDYSTSTYELDIIKTTKTQLTIDSDSSKNILNIYYKTIEQTPEKPILTQSFTVNTYLDNRLVEIQIGIGNIGSQVTNIDSYSSKPTENSELLKIENLPLTINIDESKNIVNVYYVTKTSKVFYRYFYDNVEDTNATVTEIQKYGTKINEYPAKDKPGYYVSDTENFPCVVNSEETTIKIYYTSYKKSLTLNIYLDGNLKDSKDLGTYSVGKIINSISLPTLENATLKDIDTLPYTITNTDNNIIKAYYVTNKEPEPTPDPEPPIDPEPTIEEPDPTPEPTPDPTPTPEDPEEEPETYYGKVTFKYYYDNKEDSSLAYTITVEEGTEITTYRDKPKENYKFDSVNGLPIKVTKDSNNIVSVYYVKEPEIVKYQVNVHIFIDNNEVDSYSLGMYKVGDIIDELDLSNYDKYELVSSDLPFKVSDSNNIINIYYKTKPDRNITRTVVTVGVATSIPLLLLLLYLFKDKILLLLIPPKKRKEYLYGLWTSIEGAAYIDKDGNEIKAEYDSENNIWLFFDSEGHALDIVSNEYMLDKFNRKEITYDEFYEYTLNNGYTTVIDSSYKLQTNVNEETFEETELNQTNITNTLDLYKDNEDLTTINMNCYIKNDSVSTITFIFGD